jgi:hypothetical protein
LNVFPNPFAMPFTFIKPLQVYITKPTLDRLFITAMYLDKTFIYEYDIKTTILTLKKTLDGNYVSYAEDCDRILLMKKDESIINLVL